MKDDRGPGPPDTLDAREAAALLGIRRSSLYAYVSRGLLRSAPGPRGRGRRYRRADLERLRARREARGAAGAAASALRWGDPVLDTHLTWLTPQGPVYRGRPALELARGGVRFEAVAELLWTGRLPDPAPPWPPREGRFPVQRLVRLLPADAPPLSVLSLLVPALAARDPGRFDRRAEAVLPRARRLLLRLAAGLALPAEPGRYERALRAGSVARAVAVALGARGAAAHEAVERTLVLCADHELNASTFAARVTASTYADVYACVAAALAALSGPRHGGATDRIEALVGEVGSAGRAEAVLRERQRRGEPVWGFQHPFYPGGDPRTPPLLEAAEALAPRSPRVRTVASLAEAVRGAGLGAPNLDVGLVAVAAALGAREGAAAGLFAVGRCAGWVAHVLEQYEAGPLLRPRARYVPEAEADAGVDEPTGGTP